MNLGFSDDFVVGRFCWGTNLLLSWWTFSIEANPSGYAKSVWAIPLVDEFVFTRALFNFFLSFSSVWSYICNSPD